jgi:SSS family solute:Na+ symporter/sodium/pantothenate symporter
MAALAMAARDISLWGLIELKMELLVQCVPAFLIAAHWSRLRACPTVVGLVVGSLIAVAGVFLDVKRIGGVHTGVIGLALNIAIATAGSLLSSSPPARSVPPAGGRAFQSGQSSTS